MSKSLSRVIDEDVHLQWCGLEQKSVKRNNQDLHSSKLYTYQ